MTRIVKDINFLRQKSQPVETEEEANEIIEKLDYALVQNPGLGLSAPQIGILKQVAIIRMSIAVGNEFKNVSFNIVNPEKIHYLDGQFIYRNEGCLSFPGIRKNTTRYQTVQFINDFNKELHYYSINEGEEEFKDKSLIVACQHELEHLEGKVFLDHVQDPKITNKVGRNDPCICGSGKKFKKCCMIT